MIKTQYENRQDINTGYIKQLPTGAFHSKTKEIHGGLFFFGGEGGSIKKWGMFALDDFALIWSAAEQGHAQNLSEIPNSQCIPKVISPHGNQFGWI